jgi:hydrogenase 3 maturation protease
MDRNALAAVMSKWLSKYDRLVIAGVGNSLRRDDGLGVEFVKRLYGKIPRNVLPLDCGTVPETYVGPIRRFRPSHILMVDAADLGSEVGSIKLATPEEIVGLALSTHALPLKVFADYLKAETSASIALLAIQPKNTNFGETISPEVDRTLKWVSNVVLTLLKDGSLGMRS